MSSLTWPSAWKEETQSAIPKSASPKTYEELRNISCTNFLAKILESFLFDRLSQEVKLKNNQYGGIKGTGTVHFLIDVYQKILDCLDDGKSAVSLLAIGKAFNRMSHPTCIAELAKRGATSETLALVASFLSGRKMRMKVGSTLSDPRFVNGGSPQGTKIGNFLFTVTIESIEESTISLYKMIPNVISDLNDEEPCERKQPPKRFTFYVKPIDRFASNEFTASTPVKGATTDGVLRYLDESGCDYFGNNMDLVLHGQPPPDWKKCDAWSIKYVDDLNLGQQHHMDSAISVFSTSKERKMLHADECEDVFDTVRENAARIGMRVNTKKTQLLCVSSNKNNK